MPLPKILLVMNSFYPPRGGAELCMRTLLEEISPEYKCFVLAEGKGNAVKLGPISCSFVQRPEQIKNAMARIDPDIVLTLGRLTVPAVSAAKQMGKPAVVHILDYSNFCPNPMHMQACDKRCGKCAYYNRSKGSFLEMREALSKADRIMCVTNYMGKVLKDFYGMQSQKGSFIFIRPSDFMVARRLRKQCRIGMVKLMVHKGVMTFAQIALKMPQMKFIGAGRYDPNFPVEKIPNLSYIGIVPPKKFYSQIDILLIPSIWPEPAGRVILEAMANRIPVIASNVGGIPEIMGGAGILIGDYTDPCAWIKKIELLLENEEYYARVVRKGWERSQRYSLERTVEAAKSVFRPLLKKADVT